MKSYNSDALNFVLTHSVSKITSPIEVNLPDSTITSTKFHVTHGVPQGSIFGPILFSIFVNDIFEYVNDCVLIQYADDTQFIHSGNINNLDQLISRA